ncbi:hypothetical protein BH10CYA1_BH10CYA1_26070 [soil metagenome]
MSKSCERAAAIATAKDLDNGNVEAATQKIVDCMRPNFTDTYRDMANFAAIVKQADKKGVGLDVKLHITPVKSASDMIYPYPQLEID